MGTAERLHKAAGGRARRRGIEFTLTIEEIDALMPLDARCPVLGFRMVLDDPEPDRWPSLDRIDPERGYVSGNVRIISKRANRLKGDGYPEEFRRIAEYMESYERSHT